MDYKKMQEVASKMHNLFVYKEMPEKDFKSYVFTDESFDDPMHASVSEVIHESRLGERFAYESVVAALNIISTASSESEAVDSFHVEEAPVYTSDLTSWLSESINHVGYIDEVISNGATTGSDALAGAWSAAFIEIAEATLQAVLSWEDEE